MLGSGRAEGSITDTPVVGAALGSQLNQISFRLRDLAALRAMRDRLEREGIRNFVPMNHGLAWSIYLRDVEGNPVELFVDSDWYIAQPCAEPLDLSESDGAMCGPTEAFCRQQPGFQPYAEWRDAIAGKMRLQHDVTVYRYLGVVRKERGC